MEADTRLVEKDPCDEETANEDEDSMNSAFTEDIKSTAVVKYSAVETPAHFHKLQRNINLNLPPDNWLRENGRWQILKGHCTSPGTSSTMFSSLHMANVFPDCVGEVDVVSDAENIKRLLKIPYSKSQVSMMVHRIGKTLLIDEFDIHQHLLQTAKKEWEWLRKFFFENVLKTLQHKDINSFRKNRSRGHLQHKNMLSKFLYYSITDTSSCCDPLVTQDNESYPDPVKVDGNNVPVQTQSIPLLEEELDAFRHNRDYQRNVLWTFEDIRMLIGTDMPIFGGGTHPCVSLRLRDIKKPINVLTGLDYWLDNLMCNVPEVMMCYHLDGIVQKYELIKTEDIPQMDNSKFSPVVIKDIAQNILSFLKSNATKSGHTYWLFKAKDDDVVKLYDLTSLCSDVMDDKVDNPFTVPVAMLLYRVAKNMRMTNSTKAQLGTICTLLKNCLALLNKKKHPRVVASAHYLLSDIYVPSTLNISSLSSSHSQLDASVEDDDSDSDDSDECSDSINRDRRYSLINVAKEESLSSSVSVKTLCRSEKRNSRYSNVTPHDETLSGSLEARCNAALKHVEEGLECLLCVSEDISYDESRIDKNKEEVQKMAKAFQPIPLRYESLKSRNDNQNNSANASSSVGTHSHCDSKMPITSNSQCELNGSWQKVFVEPLLRKASIAAYAMAHCTSESRIGESLRYLHLSLVCYDAIEQLKTCGKSQLNMEPASLGCSIFGLAGDIHFLLVQSSAKMTDVREQYANFSIFEGLRQAVKIIVNGEFSYEWAVEFQNKIEDCLILSAKCYQLAFDKAQDDDDKLKLRKRLGNIHNELGVFYMSQAHSVFNERGELTEDIERLWKLSAEYLDAGIVIFEDIQDDANIALLNSNLGRLMRLRALCTAPQKDATKEFTVAEKTFYDKAISYYQKALRILGDKKLYSGIWDSIHWDISTTYFTIGTLLQDYAPLSVKPQEEIEKEISEYLLKALKYCDADTSGSKQPIYQYRAAAIYRRLGSLNHHLCRNAAVDDGRKKQYRMLAEMYLSKSAQLLYSLEDCTEYIHVQLERIGLWELHLSGLLGNGARVKILHLLLDKFFETIPVLRILMEQKASEVQPFSSKQDTNSSLAAETSCENDESRDTTLKLLLLLQQRLQFTLLNLVKAHSTKSKKGIDPLLSLSKKLYSESLQTLQCDDFLIAVTTIYKMLSNIQTLFTNR